MKEKLFHHSLVCVLLVALTSPASAQLVEITPYAGWTWSGTDIVGTEMKDGGIVGFRGGGYLTPSFLLEGNLGYIANFELEGTNPQSRALIWDANGTYHFFTATRLTPFISGGLGGVTAVLGDRREGIHWLNRDTWFAVSYGGGLKGLRLWGPVGLMGEVRGRTLPDFVDDKSLTWLEAKGGLTFTFGER